MSDEIDREVTSKKVTSLPNDSINRSRISEQRTTKVSNENSANGLIIIALLALAVGAGAIAYFVNYRPASTQILVPNATDTVKENKSTVIERNNTTIREVSPATPQPTPTVEISIPITTTTPPPIVVTPQATAQPQTMAPVPASPKPVSPSPTATATPSVSN